MQLKTVKIEKPNDTNSILGQTHFVKSVEDIHEALVAAVPGIQFGLAFCEASGKCLVRWSGTDSGVVKLTEKNAAALAAGHSFIVSLGDCFLRLLSDFVRLETFTFRRMHTRTRAQGLEPFGR
jgi:uncharacterized protein